MPSRLTDYMALPVDDWGHPTSLNSRELSRRPPEGDDEGPHALSFGGNVDDVKGSGCSNFVEAGWFQVLTTCVIIFNIITMVVETNDPSVKRILWRVDYAMLTFYLMELFFRALYFRGRFVTGPRHFVAWNVLDMAVVAGGVLDEWVIPHLYERKPHNVKVFLTFLRFLRIFRALKVLRVFLQADLAWTEEPRFQSFVGTVILVNSLIMGAETDVKWGGWFFIEQVLLSIYVFELSVRLKKWGFFFLSCDNADIVWNTLDFVIVSTSVIDTWLAPLAKMAMTRDKSGKSVQEKTFKDIMMLVRMLRLMRILRLAKLVKSVRPLFVLVTGVLAALQGVAWVLVLTVVTLYALAIVATRLIGHGLVFPSDGQIPEALYAPFATVPESMFTLFRVMSGSASGEQEAAIDELMRAVPSIKFGFVFFMVTSSWTLLSILTAVVSENMITTTGEQHEEMKIASADDDRHKHIQELRELFSEIDVEGSGHVSEDALDVFLTNKKNAVKCAKSTRVPMRDVREVLATLAEGCSFVTMQQFVESLVVVGHPVTEKSIMKLESRINMVLKEEQANTNDTEVIRKILEAEMLRQREMLSSMMRMVEQLADGLKITVDRPIAGTSANGAEKDVLTRQASVSFASEGGTHRKDLARQRSSGRFASAARQLGSTTSTKVNHDEAEFPPPRPRTTSVDSAGNLQEAQGIVQELQRESSIASARAADQLQNTLGSLAARLEPTVISAGPAARNPARMQQSPGGGSSPGTGERRSHGGEKSGAVRGKAHKTAGQEGTGADASYAPEEDPEFFSEALLPPVPGGEGRSSKRGSMFHAR